MVKQTIPTEDASNDVITHSNEKHSGPGRPRALSLEPQAMNDDHFYIGTVRVQRSETVEAGHIQIENSHGVFKVVVIDPHSLPSTITDISVIHISSQMFNRYRNMKQRQLQTLLDELDD
tara:strand:+ start:11138 stop:11494 length:357 start_codon:yes stop_codon:yes gene_type:complete